MMLHCWDDRGREIRVVVLTNFLVDGDGGAQLGVREHSGHAEGVVGVGVDTIVADLRVESEGTLLVRTLKYKKKGFSNGINNGSSAQDRK